MFGYILPDKPNLYMKDYALYRSFYCGLCHEIGHCQGQCLRLSLNYDVTFLSILVHGLREGEIEPITKACVLHPLKKKPVVLGKTQRTMAYLNTLLVDFKCTDDVLDGNNNKRLLQWLWAARIRKAKRVLPEVAACLAETTERQQRVEGEKPTSWRIAAEPFADCMQEIMRLVCGDKYTQYVGNVGYFLGQYVYLLDALDDYDKDRKRHHYNPLVEAYGLPSKGEMLKQHHDELKQDVVSLIEQIKENYRRVAIFATEGIVTNTLWMGLWARAQQLLKENAKCQKTHTRF